MFSVAQDYWAAPPERTEPWHRPSPRDNPVPRPPPNNGGQDEQRGPQHPIRHFW